MSVFLVSLRARKREAGRKEMSQLVGSKNSICCASSCYYKRNHAEGIQLRTFFGEVP